MKREIFVAPGPNDLIRTENEQGNFGYIIGLSMIFGGSKGAREIWIEKHEEKE